MGRDQSEGFPDVGSGNNKGYELQQPADDYQNHDGQMVDIRGRTVDKSRTGSWKAAGFLYVVHFADILAGYSVVVSLITYLATVMHQPIGDAASISNNFTGTSYLLAVLAGFIADSYLGYLKTLIIGNLFTILGLGLLTFSSAYSGLEPSACTPTPTTQCGAAGNKYMVPLYVALYTMALGLGLVRPTIVALGGEQFDDSSPKERKQGVHFYVWYFYWTQIALLLAFTLGVYLQDDVSFSWGYGFALIVYAVCCLYFYLGVTKLRYRTPAGSFLTRMAQVSVATLLKIRVKAPGPENTSQLYDNPLPGNVRLAHTDQLRFFDKAAVIESSESGRSSSRNRWRLCGVSQVEETKRIIQLIPIWISIWLVAIVFALGVTYTIEQGSTLDRRLGPHFVLPPATLNSLTIISSLIIVPMYDKILFPFVKRFTKHPYGFKTLQRLGASIVFAMLTMITAALVERKRLTYVRSLHLQAYPLGGFGLPMKFWWLLPQTILAANVEFFLYVPAYQFFFHESATGIRTVGSSFVYSATAMGFFLSTVLQKVVNRVTKHKKGGAWLEGKLNDGGLEKFYWLMAVLLAFNFLLFLFCAHCYRYKYDWYHTNDRASPDHVHQESKPNSSQRELVSGETQDR